MNRLGKSTLKKIYIFLPAHFRFYLFSVIVGVSDWEIMLADQDLHLTERNCPRAVPIEIAVEP